MHENGLSGKKQVQLLSRKYLIMAYIMKYAGTVPVGNTARAGISGYF